MSGRASGEVDEHAKTVFAHCGLALYLAQCLEYALVNALLYVKLVPRRLRKVRTRREWDVEFDAFMERNFRDTLGRMIRNLREATAVPPHLEEKLAQALERRNWLTHHYFREHATDFMSASGRDSMIRDLEEAHELFKAAGVLLYETIRPIREKYGVSEDRLERFYRDYVSGIKGDL